MTTAPNFPLLVSALGWIDDRKLGRRRRQICHEVLARMVATGEPMAPFSRRDRDIRLPGQHTYTEGVMNDLAERGVLLRSGPRGPLPELIGLDERVYRWKVEWSIRRAEVLVRLEAFSRPGAGSIGGLTEPGAAPGSQRRKASQGQPLAQSFPQRARGGPWLSSGGQASQGQPLAQYGGAYAVSPDKETTSSYVEDDDEGLLTIKAAIVQASGSDIFGGPLTELRQVVGELNGNFDRALQVVERLGQQGIRWPGHYVAAVAELVGNSAAGEALLQRRAAEQRLAQLQKLRDLDEKWEKEATELEAQLGTLEA